MYPATTRSEVRKSDTLSTKRDNQYTSTAVQHVNASVTNSISVYFECRHNDTREPSWPNDARDVIEATLMRTRKSLQDCVRRGPVNVDALAIQDQVDTYMNDVD